VRRPKKGTTLGESRAHLTGGSIFDRPSVRTCRRLTLQNVRRSKMIASRYRKAMATTRARTATFLAAVGVMVAIAGTALYYRHGSTTDRTASVARQSSANSASSVGSIPSNGPTPEPYERGAVRLRAQAALQECLKKAQSEAKTSWDGMCAALAQRTTHQRDDCRQQGRTAADCLSAYAETPVTDCLLPHETASSIAQAQQLAKGDCYQQFQAEMR
jgi:hypothetical protein